MTVEYKSDELGHKTGNVFIETVSVDKGDGSEVRKGWAYTSTALYLVYFIPGKGEIYVHSMTAVRNAVPVWAKMYPVLQVKNEGYQSAGIAVPVKAFENRATAVYRVGGPWAGEKADEEARAFQEEVRREEAARRFPNDEERRRWFVEFLARQAAGERASNERRKDGA